ncbi:MAG: hypothetical protein HY558_08255 [Euryarchaeota archaeon]|nr:hypothetical protein [Euryarchaeota archaeon]
MTSDGWSTLRTQLAHEYPDAKYPGFVERLEKLYHATENLDIVKTLGSRLKGQRELAEMALAAVSKSAERPVARQQVMNLLAEGRVDGAYNAALAHSFVEEPDDAQTVSELIQGRQVDYALYYADACQKLRDVPGGKQVLRQMRDKRRFLFISDVADALAKVKEWPDAIRELVQMAEEEKYALLREAAQKLEAKKLEEKRALQASGGGP